MQEAARNHVIALIKQRCRKVLLHAEYRALNQLKIRVLSDSDLPKSTQISIVKSVLN